MPTFFYRPQVLPHILLYSRFSDVSYHNSIGCMGLNNHSGPLPFHERLHERAQRSFSPASGHDDCRVWIWRVYQWPTAYRRRPLCAYSYLQDRVSIKDKERISKVYNISELTIGIGQNYYYKYILLII